MNFEFCDQASFSKAQGLINGGSTKEGVAVLLEARDLFAKQGKRVLTFIIMTRAATPLLTLKNVRSPRRTDKRRELF